MLNRTSLPSNTIIFEVSCWLRYRLTLRELSEVPLRRGPSVSCYVDDTYLKVWGKWATLHHAVD